MSTLPSAEELIAKIGVAEDGKHVLHAPPVPVDEFRKLLADRELLSSLAGFAGSLHRDKPHLADDQVQDTIAKAMQARESFRAGTNLKAWLCRIMRNNFLTERRRSWRWGELADEHAVRIPCPSSAQATVELKQAFVLIELLPPEQREALLLAADGYDYEAIAKKLRCQTGTVKSRIMRAREKLASMIGEEYKPEKRGKEHDAGFRARKSIDR